MSKNTVSWFAVMVFAGLLSACGQNADQGATDNAAEPPAQTPAAPSGGEPPAAPTGN
jgi:hypothetical protein